MNFKQMIAVGAIALSPALYAQSVYKCGSTYSQAPCGADAKQLNTSPPQAKLPTDVVPPDDVVKANKVLCEKLARLGLKDPEGARITEMKRYGPRRIDFQGVSTAVLYMFEINAKNSYGGFTGEKTGICLFSLDDKKFLRMMGG